MRFDGNDEIIEAMLSVEGEVVELVNKAGDGCRAENMLES